MCKIIMLNANKERHVLRKNLNANIHKIECPPRMM